MVLSIRTPFLRRVSEWVSCKELVHDRRFTTRSTLHGSVYASPGTRYRPQPLNTGNGSRSGDVPNTTGPCDGASNETYDTHERRYDAIVSYTREPGVSDYTNDRPRNIFYKRLRTRSLRMSDHFLPSVFVYFDLSRK